MFRKLSLPLLLLLISSVYLYTATSKTILDDNDALYATVAQQMISRGEWVTPYANGVRFLDKPPMMYWLMALAYEVFGVSEFAARLPSVLAVLGTGVLLYFLGKKAGGHTSGFTAGVAAAFCVGTFLFTRMVFPDILFVFLLTLSLCSFLEWYSDEKNPLLPAMLFYASLAGAILTKGLIGVFLPVAIIALFMTRSRDWARLGHFHIGKGTLLFLVLALPWHMLAAYRNPGFLWYFFVNEQVLRFLGRRQPVDYESISLPIFWALILLWLFPWSAFFPAIRYLLRASDEPRTSNSNAAIWLSLSWTLVVLVFFSLSSRIEHYSLPLFPPLALLVGLALSPEDLRGVPTDHHRQRLVAKGFTFLGILGGILAVILLVFGLIWLGGRFQIQGIRSIAVHNLHAYKYYFAPLFDFPPEILASLTWPLAGTGLALSLGLPGAWWINKRGSRMRAILVLSGTMMVFCLFTFQSLGVCEEILSSKQFGRKLTQLYRPGDYAITIGDFETANSVNFYSPIPLEVYGGTAAVLQWGLRYPDAPARILSRPDLAARWNSSMRTFLLGPDNKITALRLNHSYPVMRSAGRTLVSNQPLP